MKNYPMHKKWLLSLVALVTALLACVGLMPRQESFDLQKVPAFSGEAYVVIEDNVPGFSKKDFTTDAYEFYSELDHLGRCGYAMACIGQELMPTEERQGIGQIKPTGWHLSKYDFVDGKYLYNRCHLIGFQLTGENANERNLITGTRYMNVQGMLPFEEQIADYIRQTDHHVLYRVTPVFAGDNLLASGVQMEAISIEDSGSGVCFNVYVYNNQPGVVIDYATGENTPAPIPEGQQEKFVLNTGSKRFHLETCDGVKTMSEKNKELYQGTRQLLLDMGYKPCGSCNP